MSLSRETFEGGTARRAQVLGMISVVAITMLTACILGILALGYQHLDSQRSRTRFIQLVAQQISTAERMVKLSLVVTEGNKNPRIKTAAITATYARERHRDLSSSLDDFQSIQRGLQFGGKEAGTSGPAEREIQRALNDINRMYSLLVEDTKIVVEQKAPRDTVRKKLGEMVKLSEQYREKMGEILSMKMKQSSEAMDAILVQFSYLLLASIIPIVFLFVTTVKVNLATLLRTVAELKSTKSELEFSLTEAETAMSISQMAAKRFEGLFSGMPIGCFTCDRAGTIYEWNEALVQLTGWEAYEVYNMSIFDTIYAHTSRVQIDGLLQRVFEGESIDSVEIREHRRDGQEIVVMVSLLPMRGASGEITSVISANVDITDVKKRELELAESREKLKSLNAKLHQLATTDGLTGLTNNRTFRERLAVEVSSAKTDGSTLSVGLMDVDRFKQYNDSFGHPAGDQVLRQVAALLRDNAPEGALVARYGGEEFVVIFPNTTAEQAVEHIDRMRVAIEQASWPHRAVTASFGVESLSGEMRPEDLIDHADQALYHSKESGRNRVSHYRELGQDELNEAA